MGKQFGSLQGRHWCFLNVATTPGMQLKGTKLPCLLVTQKDEYIVEYIFFKSSKNLYKETKNSLNNKNKWTYIALCTLIGCWGGSERYLICYFWVELAVARKTNKTKIFAAYLELIPAHFVHTDITTWMHETGAHTPPPKRCKNRMKKKKKKKQCERGEIVSGTHTRVT